MSFEILLSKTYSAVFGIYFVVGTMILTYKIGRANRTSILSGHSELFDTMLMETVMSCFLIILLKNFLDVSLGICCVISFFVGKVIVHVMIMAGRASYRKQFFPAYNGKSLLSRLFFL